MVFIYNLQRVELIALIALVLVCCGVTYYFAVKSRKSYRCPECGEKFTGEYMSASRCGMCGALLNEANTEEE